VDKEVDKKSEMLRLMGLRANAGSSPTANCRLRRKSRNAAMRETVLGYFSDTFSMLTTDQKVSGSNPLGRATFYDFVAVISPLF
jgi:hypothetical protein